MGTLVLVRHGQASFGSADYDRLSELGQRQCARLGEHFRERRLRFDAVLRGTLRRHEQSLTALLGGFGAAPDVLALPGLNEYDPEAVVRSVAETPLEPARTPEAARAHFRLLREGLLRWARDEVAPAGMPRFADFAAGVGQALEAARQHRGDVLVMTSGGPIGAAVMQVLGAPAETFVELNLRLRNTAITELAASPRRLVLHSFNHLPHLEGLPPHEWVTYA